MNHDRHYHFNVFVSKQGAKENKSLESNIYACISNVTTFWCIICSYYGPNRKKIPLSWLHATQVLSLKFSYFDEEASTTSKWKKLHMANIKSLHHFIIISCHYFYKGWDKHLEVSTIFISNSPIRRSFSFLNVWCIITIVVKYIILAWPN